MASHCVGSCLNAKLETGVAPRLQHRAEVTMEIRATEESACLCSPEAAARSLSALYLSSSATLATMNATNKVDLSNVLRSGACVAHLSHPSWPVGQRSLCQQHTWSLLNAACSSICLSLIRASYASFRRFSLAAASFLWLLSVSVAAYLTSTST